MTRVIVLEHWELVVSSLKQSIVNNDLGSHKSRSELSTLLEVIAAQQ
jgi:hypothetical protein